MEDKSFYLKIGEMIAGTIIIIYGIYRGSPIGVAIGAGLLGAHATYDKITNNKDK